MSGQDVGPGGSKLGYGGLALEGVLGSHLLLSLLPGCQEVSSSALPCSSHHDVFHCHKP